MQRPHKTGFTLVETIISCLIVSLTIIFIFNLFPTSMAAIKRSETEIQASNLAQSLLEQMRAQGFANLSALPAATVPIDNTNYQYVTTVGPVPGTDARFLKRASVTIRWKARHTEQTMTREVWVHSLKR